MKMKRAKSSQNQRRKGEKKARIYASCRTRLPTSKYRVGLGAKIQSPLKKLRPLALPNPDFIIQLECEVVRTQKMRPKNATFEKFPADSMATNSTRVF
jgi:hypothetical protein